MFDEDFFFLHCKAFKYYHETENYARLLCEVKPNKPNKRTLLEKGEKKSGNILIFLRGTDFIAHGKLDAKMLHTSLQCGRLGKMKNTKLYINQAKKSY